MPPVERCTSSPFKYSTVFDEHTEKVTLSNIRKKSPLNLCKTDEKKIKKQINITVKYGNVRNIYIQDFFVGFGRGVLAQNFDGHWDLDILSIRCPDTLVK